MSMDTISDNTSGATDDTLRAAFEAAMRDAGWTNVSRDAAIEATRIVLATKTPADIAAAVRAAVKRAPWIAR